MNYEIEEEKVVKAEEEVKEVSEKSTKKEEVVAEEKVSFKDSVEITIGKGKKKSESVVPKIDYSDAPLFSREEGFKLVLDRLRDVKDPVIVEVGCIRQVNDIGAGNSTELFAWFVSKYGGKFISCDISKHNTNLARSVVSKYTGDITINTLDGLSFLRKLKDKADLLYLDSFDATPTYYDISAQHHLELFKVYESKVKPGCLILIDDIYDVNTYAGKGAKLIPYLFDNYNYNCLLKGYQFLFVRR